MSPHTDTGALLPCPFCGASPFFPNYDAGDDDFVVQCICGASSRYSDVQADVISAWNTRAASQGTAGGEQSEVRSREAFGPADNYGPEDNDPGTAFVHHNVDDTITIKVRSAGDRVFSEVEMSLEAWLKLRSIPNAAQAVRDPWANAIDPDARTPGDDLGPSELIRIELRQAMLDCWNSICADTDCHPLDIKHQGKKLFFTPDHWADMVAWELSCRLSHHASMRVPAQAPSVGVLHDIYITMRHARTFITSREKMHPTGVDLWDRLFAQIEALQASPVTSAQEKSPAKQQGNWARVTEPCRHQTCEFPACDCEWDPIPSAPSAHSAAPCKHPNAKFWMDRDDDIWMICPECNAKWVEAPTVTSTHSQTPTASSPGGSTPSQRLPE